VHKILRVFLEESDVSGVCIYLAQVSPRILSILSPPGEEYVRAKRAAVEGTKSGDNDAAYIRNTLRIQPGRL